MTLPENLDAGVPTLQDTLDKIKALSEKAAAENSAPVESPPAEPTEVEAGAAVPDVRSESAPAAEPEQTQPAATPPQAEVISPRLRRLMEREASLIEREKKLKELEATSKPATSSEQLSLEALRRLYRANPREALKHLDDNFQPGRLARKLWIDDLGDLAPKEARAEVEAEYAKSSVEVLREEMEAREQRLLAQIQEQQAQQAYMQYTGALEQYALNQVPESLPLTKKFVAKNPAKVVQALLGVAQKHARATGGQVLTPEQAATKLEASLKELQLVDPGPSPETAPAASTPQAPSVPNTLRNKHTSVQPNRGGDDSLDDEALFKRSMALIEAEKKRRAGLGY